MKDMKISAERRNLILTGAVVGAAAFILVLFGNPGNMGLCIACFLRDIAGSLGLQSTATVQYMRPEILGLVLGAFIISVIKGEFNPRSGSSPVIRFLMGAGVSIGALVFLGCPLRMVLRLAAGDLNALMGLIGFVMGVAAGSVCLHLGFSLGRTRETTRLEGSAISIISIILLIILAAAPSLLRFSTSGPGSMRAPVAASLAAGLLVGVFAQRSRMCFAGGLRDLFLIKDTTLITGFIAVFLSALVLNIAGGKFILGFEGQPVAHTDALWNIMGMVVVGFGSVLLGGCPLRQLILAGEGNSDSAVTVLGLVAGGAIAHNFSLASSTDGPTDGGKAAVMLILLFFAAVAAISIYMNRRKEN